MTKEDLIKRNRKFAIDVLMTLELIPSDRVHDALVRQLVRSSTSVGANYRAACRGKSKADFIYKIEVVLEEADESLYWLQATKAAELVQHDKLDPLINEANELVSIFNATDISAKRNRDK